jgi:hypothetical protein
MLCEWANICEMHCKTRIPADLIRRKLTRAILLGGTGILLLIIAGSQMPLPTLQRWGIPILIIGIGAIAFGMVPYRRLIQLRDHPDELILEDGELIYLHRFKPVMAIPLANVERLEYRDGILLWLCDQKEPIHFPHFPQSALKKLKSGLEDVVHLDET